MRSTDKKNELCPQNEYNESSNVHMNVTWGDSAVKPENSSVDKEEHAEVVKVEKRSLYKLITELYVQFK